MSDRVKTLLRNGTLQEIRNKEFTLKLTTALVTVLMLGFLAGLTTSKILAEAATSAPLITQKTKIYHK